MKANVLKVFLTTLSTRNYVPVLLYLYWPTILPSPAIYCEGAALAKRPKIQHINIYLH